MNTKNKKLMHRIIDDVLPVKNFNELTEELCPASQCYADDVCFHDPFAPGGCNGVDTLRQMVEYYNNAFPDSHYTIEDLIEEGDKVTIRWSVSGTHEGEVFGIPATHKRVDNIMGIAICRIENDKIQEVWQLFDQPGLLRQLGVSS